ncbi:porin [Micromonospora sp. KC207]|nr:porin [Micromonospora sp. KC207]
MLGVVAALLAIGVVAALKFGLGGAVAAAFDSDGTAKAKAGDCLAELPDVAEGERKDARGAQVVACTSTEAVYTVVGRLDGQTEGQARTGEACEPFLQPGQAGYFFYNIKPGSTGYLLCLTRKAA